MPQLATCRAICAIALAWSVPLTMHAQDTGQTPAWESERQALLASSLRLAPCDTAPAATFIRARAEEAGATGAALTEMLTDLALDESACEPLRDAALSVALEEMDALQDMGAVGEAEAATLVAAIVSDAYAEADMRAAQLTFEVGPPPRNITKGRMGY